MNILFHLVIIDQDIKKKIINIIKAKYNIIDLDKINEHVLNMDNFQKNYKKYLNFKDNKNDNFKEIDKKLTNIWETSFKEIVEQSIPQKKKIVLVGMCHHYRLISKKIDFNTNKFIIIGDIKDTTKNIIKKNLDNNYNKIISGAYLLENIDYNIIKKKIKLIIDSYVKSNYLEKSEEEIINIINLSNETITSNGLWICMKDEYKLGSLIHPIKDYIYSYMDPVYAIVESIKFNNELEKFYKDNKVSLKIKNMNKCKKKLCTKRYLYLVDKHNFIPSEKGDNLKYFSQSPAKILDKEELKNVFNKFKELNLI
tara:strand:- start:1874 stop:2806 length:933 start_codon:yes stop_codon:yes gene_type:complete